MKKIILILLLFAVACGTVHPRPVEYNVSNIYNVVNWAWYDFYGRNDRPPNVVLLFSDKLDCAYGHGFMQKNAQANDNTIKSLCASGAFTAPNQIVLAWPRTQTPAKSSLCHELWHAIMLRNTGNSDGLHKSEGYMYGGDVVQCQKFLATME